MWMCGPRAALGRMNSRQQGPEVRLRGLHGSVQRATPAEARSNSPLSRLRERGRGRGRSRHAPARVETPHSPIRIVALTLPSSRATEVAAGKSRSPPARTARVSPARHPCRSAIEFSPPPHAQHAQHAGEGPGRGHPRHAPAQVETPRPLSSTSPPTEPTSSTRLAPFPRAVCGGRAGDGGRPPAHQIKSKHPDPWFPPAYQSLTP
jgi:hypothetical protein